MLLRVEDEAMKLHEPNNLNMVDDSDNHLQKLLAVLQQAMVLNSKKIIMFRSLFQLQGQENFAVNHQLQHMMQKADHHQQTTTPLTL